MIIVIVDARTRKAWRTMKFTPTQQRRLSELLAKPSDSLESLLGEIEELVTRFEVERDRFILFAWHPSHKVAQAVGPYATFNQAKKDAPNRIVQTGGTQVTIAPLLDPSQVDVGQGEMEQVSLFG